MPNQIDGSGITIETYDQIISDILNGNANAPGMYSIYGTNINVASNSPDGQFINIFALAEEDMLNFMVSVYNSFNPDLANGTALDQISQYCGLTRKAGTYTQTPVSVTTTSSVTLNGLDTSTPYTVQDSVGNQFNLVSSVSLTTGTFSLTFQAANIGNVIVSPNTITVPVTIVGQVSTINNPLSPTVTGQNQETDSNFRIRRQASTAFPAQGPLQALYAGLNSLQGVNQAVVYENTTSSTNSDGVPAHGIWVIVDGLTTLVGSTIYLYRSLGVPMKGVLTTLVPQIDGSTFQVNFDTVSAMNIYFKATLTALNGSSIDKNAIKNYLQSNYTFMINEIADISTLDGFIRAANPNVVASALGVSTDNVNFLSFVSPTTKQYKFQVLTSNITLT